MRGPSKAALGVLAILDFTAILASTTALGLQSRIGVSTRHIPNHCLDSPGLHRPEPAVRLDALRPMPLGPDTSRADLDILPMTLFPKPSYPTLI